MDQGAQANAIHGKKRECRQVCLVWELQSRNFFTEGSPHDPFQENDAQGQQGEEEGVHGTGIIARGWLYDVILVLGANN